jgi:threonine dehydrogenase-like Zn-dependent dehydrogenase
MADGTLVSLSNDLDETKGLLLGDVFATGYFCADNAISNKKGLYVVIGCGPVGLMAIMAAKHLGAENVYAVDYVRERLEIAVEFGAIPINPNDRDAKAQIDDLTEGRGADAIMEAVGGSKALRLAADLVRPGGIISSVGVHTDQHFPFSPIEAYNKNLTYKSGRCPAKYYADKLLRNGAAQNLPIEKIITHRFSLKNGAEAYEVFDKKRDNCIKTVLVP